MASIFAYRYRKMIAAVGLGVRTSATEVDASTPTITAGSGDPTASEPNGSIYLKTDASDADDAVWSRIGGAWAQIKGKTA